MINYNNINSSPPSISLPSSAFGDSKARTRSRAGTLPSNFMNGNVQTVNSHILGDASSPLVTGINSDNFGLPPIDSISISPSPNNNTIDIPGSQGESTRRMRSGSLFSTNSIWNDDAASNHSPSQSNSLIMDGSSLYSFENSTNNTSTGSNMFLSPGLGAQGSSIPQNGNANGFSGSSNNSNGQRNRSYTTTATNSNLSIPISNGAFGMESLNSQRLSSQINTASNKPNDMNSLLDNMMSNMINVPMINTRTRSQTYSGSVPVSMQSSQIYNPTLLSGPQNQPPNKTNSTIQTNSYAQNQNQNQPLLQDNYDFSQMALTTNFENTNLAPTTFLLFDNLPLFVDAVKLLSILNNSLGGHMAVTGIKSVRVSSTNTSKLALVECTSVEIAMNLKASFNHLELVPGVVIYAAFAKILDNTTEAEPVLQKPVIEKPKTHPIDVLSIRDNLLESINQLRVNNNRIDIKKIISSINKSAAYPNENYQGNFGPLPDPIPLRQFDSPKLRELRKILESNENSSSPKSSHSNLTESDECEITVKKMTQLELEELCLAMLDELPELCYDYLGNTIVQKLFSLVESPLIKLMMVKEIAPFLTQLSIHKNGTWAIQKIIGLCDNDYQQKYLIGASLKPYTVKLFNDQFGNYVLQGCVKFGSPFNDFIFETLVDNFLEISSGRFGARCIRTILETANESNAISSEQVLLVAGLIVEFANELALNNNGSLLITWFLDTFTGFGGALDNRYQLLAKAFLPNLSKLCTHKLANLTILKMLNNRSDSIVKSAIMDSIFGKFDAFENETVNKPSKLLEFILNESQENTAGPLFIYKILSNSMLLGYNDDVDRSRNSQYQQFIILQIKRILLEININNFQPYKKLMDEVGLPSTRISRSSSGSRRGKRNSRGNGKLQPHLQSTVQPAQQSIISSLPYGSKQIIPQYSGIQYSQNFQPIPPMSHQPVMQQPPVQSRHQLYQQHQSELVVLQQLEQLSLSSAALAYNSNPGTPSAASNQNNQFF